MGVCNGKKELETGYAAFFCITEQVKEEKIYVEGGDVNHMKNVLHVRDGKELTVMTDKAVSTCVQWNPMKQIWQCLRSWRKAG